MTTNSQSEGFDHEAFGRRLRAARIMLGLTEEEAAAAAGRSVETWRTYENTGKGYITGPLLKFVAKYRAGPLRRFVNLDWLVCGDGPPPLSLVSSNSVHELAVKAVQS